MSIDVASYKEAMSQLSCAVTVVTTKHHDQYFGMTVSAFTSVSIHPPSVLVCIDKKGEMSRIIKESKIFAVNILSAKQKHLGVAFSLPGRDCHQLLAQNGFHEVKTTAPILNDNLAWLDCRVEHMHDVGDHIVFFGDVLACMSNQNEKPLLYFRREWSS